MDKEIYLGVNPFKYGNKYCQHEEENILLTIFDIIGHKRTLCDIGARLRLSNSRRLIEEYDYTATLIDAHAEATDELCKFFYKKENVRIVNTKITIGNVNKYVDADFLSLDIDTNDWWVWAYLTATPRVVCVEFNNHLEGLTICPYDPEMIKGNDGAGNENASFEAFVMLGHLKGYACIAKTGINAIFVLKSLWREHESLSDIVRNRS